MNVKIHDKFCKKDLLEKHIAYIIKFSFFLYNRFSLYIPKTIDVFKLFFLSNSKITIFSKNKFKKFFKLHYCLGRKTGVCNEMLGF